MTEQYNDEYDDVFDDDDGVQQGSNLVRDLRKQLRDKAKAEKTLNDQLAAAKQKLRENAVSSVLTAKGVKPKVAKLIPSDVDPTEEAIEKWLGEFGDVFNIERNEGGGEGDGSEGEEASPDQEQLDRINKTTQTAQAPAVGNEAVMQKLMDPKLTKEQLLALVNGTTEGA